MTNPDESIWPINFSLTIGGDDLSSYVVEMEFKSSLCSPMGHLDISVAPNQPYTINPYETVILYINGTKVFTGYTQNHVKGRLPIQESIFCEDALARVRDTWVDEPNLKSNEESVTYWIEYFLNKAGVSYNVASGGPPVPEKEFGFVNALSEITDLLKYVNWQMTVTADGVVQVLSHGVDILNVNEINILTYERDRNDSWLRNRAVVFGYDQESTVELSSTVEYLEDEVRTATVASPEIYWPGTAYMLAWLILNEFSTPWDVRTVECSGNPDVRVGSTVHINHEWNDDDHYGLVTSLRWRISEDVGYLMQVTLDEKCPSYWVSDTPPNILYCATEGAGVWKTYNNGRNWFDISGKKLNTGLPSYVKDIHVIKQESRLGSDDIIWAATLGGIFKTETGASPWTNMTSEYMDGKAQSIDWWGVISDPADKDKVYCLGNHLSDSIFWSIYMYITDDGGETWNSYKVNYWDGVNIRGLQN